MGAGSEPDGHGPSRTAAGAWYRTWAPGWLDALRAVVAEERIDFVFPGHDVVLTALAEHREAIGAGVVAPATETVLRLRSRRATYEALTAFVRVPEIHDDPDATGTWPVFVKPERGRRRRAPAWPAASPPAR